MEAFKTFTYGFVGINIVATTLFTVVALLFGAGDLVRLIRGIRESQVDEMDDGRVTDGSGDR